MKKSKTRAKTKKAAKKSTKTTAAKKAPRAVSAASVTMTVPEATRLRWEDAARRLSAESVGFTGPFAVVLGESIDVARFTAQRWQPERDETTRAVVAPGLASVVRADQAPTPFALTPTLHEGTSQEIVELHALAQSAQTAYLLSAAVRAGDNPRVRAAKVVGDLRGAVESYLDDGVEDEDDARLARVRAAHADDPETADALAGELVDYAALAESLLPGIEHYGDFTTAWITDARTLAGVLRARTDGPVTQETAEALAALDLRNRLATLLAARVRLVRSKARFVFRAYPALLREVMSAYARRQRAAHRRKQKAATPKPG